MHDSDSGISPIFAGIRIGIGIRDFKSTGIGTGIGIREFGPGSGIGIKDFKADQIPLFKLLDHYLKPWQGNDRLE